MPDDRFNAPKKIAINRVYTRNGDGGLTRLVGGQKRQKHDLRISAYGAIDELNAYLGSARLSLAADTAGSAAERLDTILLRVQHELFNAGSILATLPQDVHPKQPRIRDSDVARLEAEIDMYNADLGELRSFVLPGGSRANVDLHVCRTVCRRAERGVSRLAEAEDVDMLVLAYLNRLSDALFVWSRWVCSAAAKPQTTAAEVLWDPNVGASEAETTEQS